MTTPPKDAPVTCPEHPNGCYESESVTMRGAPKDAPVTEAGRRLLATLDGRTTLHDIRMAVLAIEAEATDEYKEATDAAMNYGQGYAAGKAEAATAARSDEIDVETLARAYRNLQRPGARDDVDIAPGWLQDAQTIAAEYARLRSEQGERTPRVDSEIDAT